MKIRDFVYAYNGANGEQIVLYKYDKGEGTTVNIEDLFRGKYDEILDKELEDWDYTNGIVNLNYFES